MMRSNSSDANNSPFDHPTSSTPSAQSDHLDKELLFVLTLQEILASQVNSAHHIIIEEENLHIIASNLLLDRRIGGEAQFWRQYHALASGYPRLYECKSRVFDLLDALDAPSIEHEELREEGQADLPGVLLSQVTQEAVEWFWKPIVPLGKLTLLDGDPGTGKSLLLCDLAARLTRGWQMPDGIPGIRGGVVIIAPEDGLSDTIQPRLARAGADLNQIVCLNTVDDIDGGIVSERPFSLSQDLDLLEAAIVRVQAKLVIIDPLQAVLGKREPSQDSDVRALLAPLQGLMARLQVACVMVRHLIKKGGENVLYRGAGSIAFLALARSGLLAVHDPEDETRQVLVQCKSNLGPVAQSLAYRISDNKDQGDERPYLTWEGPSPLTAKHLGTPARTLAALGSGRQTILALLKEHGEAGLSPQQIAEKLPELGASNLRMTLKRMVENGQISQTRRGIYVVLSA